MACRNCEKEAAGNDGERCCQAMRLISEAIEVIGDCHLPTMLHDCSITLLQQSRRLINEAVPPGRGNETMP